jgi:hypothetical protein
MAAVEGSCAIERSGCFPYSCRVGTSGVMKMTAGNLPDHLGIGRGSVLRAPIAPRQQLGPKLCSRNAFIAISIPKM